MSKITFYFKACNKVEGFKSMAEVFVRKMVINGMSKSTYNNYLRQFSKISIHFGRTPLELSQLEIDEYLHYLIQNDTEDLSTFKHLVYGLKKLYSIFNRKDIHISLPKIKETKKLPVVLSFKEMRCLLNASPKLRERVMIGLIYDAGLRIGELTKLRLYDVDLDRKQLHIRQSKNYKDRYIPISLHAVRGIKKYLNLNNPDNYLFENSFQKGKPIPKWEIRKILNAAVSKSGIAKNVVVHTLRHTYATHQIESGVDIMTLKDLLGHGHLNTTLIYLKVAQTNKWKASGCLDALYSNKDE
jgi:site-specific recombinase XerD